MIVGLFRHNKISESSVKLASRSRSSFGLGQQSKLSYFWIGQKTSLMYDDMCPVALAHVMYVDMMYYDDVICYNDVICYDMICYDDILCYDDVMYYDVMIHYDDRALWHDYLRCMMMIRHSMIIPPVTMMCMSCCIMIKKGFLIHNS